METERAGKGYLEHLTDSDLRTLGELAGLPSPTNDLRARPELVVELLAAPETFERVFREPQPGDRGDVLAVSPFLVFALAVHRAAAELARSQYVTERSGPRERVPVFDAPQLHEFLAEPMRQLYLAELLASFTNTRNGLWWVKSGGGRLAHRYHELDLVGLARLVDEVPEEHRPGVYRRLGDTTLFLTGLFPDYAQRHAMHSADAARLLDAAGVEQGPGAGRDGEPELTAPGIRLWEYLGQRWYRAARSMVPVASTQIIVMAEVAERFKQARRVLNHIADHYLFPTGSS